MTSLLQEVEMEISHFDSYFVYQDFFDFFDDNTGAVITSKNCEGLNKDNLLPNGYQIITTEKGDSIYAKFSNDTISYVNFKENIYQTIILSQLDDALAQVSKMKKITSIEEVEIVAEQMMQILEKIKATKGRVDKILTLLGKASVSTVQNDYQEMLSSSKELASALTDLAGMVSKFVEKTQTKIFAPIKSLQDKYNKLHSEWSLAKAHAAKSKDINKHLFWKSIAARLEEQMTPIQFILKQKWVVNVGNFIAKYAPVANIVFEVASAVEKIGTVVGVASTIFPCEDDLFNACRAMVYAIDAVKEVCRYVAASLSVEVVLDGTTIATSETIIGVVACVALKFIASWGVHKVTGWHFNNKIKALEKMIVNLKCYQPCKNGYCHDNDNDNNGGDHKSNNKDKDFGIDPSGFVYESVPSNRLQGVTATAYYKEMVEDMYGDEQENVVKWDASQYAQENPLFTDEYGMYRWDVPQGLWQVKFEKEGYETTYSDWLPVPPPQLDINIPMTQARQPEVKDAHAYEDGVEVSFDKYMTPASLTTDNILVSQNGESVEGTVKLLDEEVATDKGSVKFASRVRFVPETPFTSGEVTLYVRNRVKSYADIPMQDDYEQTLTIEKEVREVLADSLVKVPYKETSTITVAVRSAEAAAGKALTVKTSSSMILSVEKESYVIDEEGKAAVIVTGELPGTAALTFSVEGTDKTATTIVNVEQKTFATVSAPTASIASGSLVQVGTEIYLFCKTEDATIYYTTDGSCPCDENGSRKVYDGTPIVITNDVTIKAMAVASDGAESEVVEFRYTIGTGIDDLLIDDDVQVYPLPVHDKLNVTAGGKLIKSVTVSSTSGTAVAASGKPMAKVTLDVSHIPAGIYIVAVTTEKGGYSCKIVKEQ